MLWMTRFSRHAGLVDRMADTLGIDLSEEIQRGHLQPQELRNTVANCVGCLDPDGCEVWLATHADGSDETPAYCRNKERLEEMAKKL